MEQLMLLSARVSDLPRIYATHYNRELSWKPANRNATFVEWFRDVVDRESRARRKDGDETLTNRTFIFLDDVGADGWCRLRTGSNFVHKKLATHARALARSMIIVKETKNIEAGLLADVLRLTVPDGEYVFDEICSVLFALFEVDIIALFSYDPQAAVSACAAAAPFWLWGANGTVMQYQAAVGIFGDNTGEAVSNFRLTPAGPAVVFWAAAGESRAQLVAGREINPTKIIGEYNGANWMVQMVSGITWDTIKVLSVWCEEFQADFDHIVIGIGTGSPSPSTIPSATGSYNLHWKVSPDTNTINLGLEIQPSSNLVSPLAFWAGFGVPDPINNNSVVMIGSDVSLVGVDRNGNDFGLGYYLAAQSQCDYQGTKTAGVCPNSAGNLVGTLGAVAQPGGYRFFHISRPLQPPPNSTFHEILHDELRAYVWAYGPLSEDTTQPIVLYHGPKNHAPSDLKIQFTPPTKTCTPLTVGQNTTMKPNLVPPKTISNVQTFNVTIGQNANYPNPPAWGISYHINGLESPVLNLTRGTTYSFSIMASDQHPFIITNSILGGFGLSGVANLSKNDIVYAGGDKSFGTAASPYTLTFTPNATTPSAIFYQCWTHQKLGWRIYVSDPTPSPSTNSTAAPATSATPKAGSASMGRNMGFDTASVVLILITAFIM
ncbi:hypothetical protein HDU93_005710 [Gonapodya sp. JEL0774]|nr:hypothetical protein HDU93_005710 [Gonapodya sp. JEL0774]